MTNADRRGRKGDGSVFESKDKDGRFIKWVARFTITHYPKRKYKTWTSKDKKSGKQIVTRKMREYQRQIEQTGIAAIGSKQTVGAYLQYWLDNTVRLRCVESTYLSYQQVTRLYIAHALGGTRLTELSSQDVRHLLNELAQQRVARNGNPISKRTVQYCHSILRACLNQAVEDRLIARNPAVSKTVRPPAPRREEVQTLSPEETQALLQAVQGHLCKVTGSRHTFIRA